MADPSVDLSSIPLDREVGQLLRADICRKIRGVAIGRVDNTLVVAVEDATDPAIYDLIDVSTDHAFKANLVQADRALIQLAHEYIFSVPLARLGEPWKQWLDTKRLQNEKLATAGQEVGGNAVELADRLLKEAIAVGASDVHLETFQSHLRVRFRQDGLLRVVDEIYDLDLAHALIKRLKVMANMDITQERLTQGGRISVEIAGRGFDLRCSIVPVPSGESLVMRLLSKGSFNTTLEDLGFSPAQLAVFKSMIERPHGLILTSGPTGSGKSTTLYASLKSIARDDRKLLTVEDPIEYEMPGIIQVQTHTSATDPEKRVTFASALREFLRQDPDVILVGEIRDPETASISIQAALTGHLVLSTIHTNDAVGIVNRLKNQGVPAFMIASTLLGGIAQRLIRRLCSHCKQPAPLDEEILAMMNQDQLSDIQAFQARGCEHCRDSGYKGRVGLYEMLRVNNEIRELIEQNATALQIRQAARRQGLKTLWQDGLRKVASGLVSLEEVKRVCQAEED